MKKIVFHHDYTILDASCVINLYASGKMLEILEVGPSRFAIADYVRDREALKIYTGPDDDVMRTKEAINLAPFIDNKLMIVASPSCEDEFMDYVNFAYYLDDGEALTGAIAKYRNWGIGIDERKGISFFTNETPQLQLVSTPELIKHWVDAAGPSYDTIRTVLRNIRFRARYYPGTEHTL